MHELSLHILDVMENAVCAGATMISVSVEEDLEEGLLTICVEDDGPGFPIAPRAAVSPFFTTKSGKRTGLGLSLFEVAAEQAGGALTVGSSTLGGASVTATFELQHVDRAPLGDLAVTVLSMILTHKELEILCRLRSSGGERRVRASVASFDPDGRESDPIAVATAVGQRIREGLKEIGMTA